MEQFKKVMRFNWTRNARETEKKDQLHNPENWKVTTDREIKRKEEKTSQLKWIFLALL